MLPPSSNPRKLHHFRQACRSARAARRVSLSRLAGRPLASNRAVVVIAKPPSFFLFFFRAVFNLLRLLVRAEQHVVELALAADAVGDAQPHMTPPVGEFFKRG